jgi:hypothetical protein
MFCPTSNYYPRAPYSKKQHEKCGRTHFCRAPSKRRAEKAAAAAFGCAARLTH